MQVNLLKMKRRSNCPLSCWLDLFGDKWTLLILRDILIFDKKNYKDFIGSKEGISTNILADRLKKMVEKGILTKKIDPDNKLLFNYEATEKGQSLKPILGEIVRWSNAHISDTTNSRDWGG